MARSTCKEYLLKVLKIFVVVILPLCLTIIEAIRYQNTRLCICWPCIQFNDCTNYVAVFMPLCRCRGRRATKPVPILSLRPVIDHIEGPDKCEWRGVVLYRGERALYNVSRLFWRVASFIAYGSDARRIAESLKWYHCILVCGDTEEHCIGRCTRTVFGYNVSPFKGLVPVKKVRG